MRLCFLDTCSLTQVRKFSTIVSSSKVSAPTPSADVNRCCPRGLRHSPPSCAFLPLFCSAWAISSRDLCRPAPPHCPARRRSPQRFSSSTAAALSSSLRLFSTLGHGAETPLFTHSPKLTEHVHDHCPEPLLADCLLPLCLALLLGVGFVPSFGTYPSVSPFCQILCFSFDV